MTCAEWTTITIPCSPASLSDCRRSKRTNEVDNGPIVDVIWKEVFKRIDLLTLEQITGDQESSSHVFVPDQIIPIFRLAPCQTSLIKPH